MNRLEVLKQQALPYLPGFLYSFNIADFKRRNIHLGYEAGDRDIEELDRLLRELAAATAFVERTHGQRWLMISRQNVADRVRTLLDQYKRSSRILTGWSMQASKGANQEGHKSKSQVVQAEIRRAVRCLYAGVRDADGLAAMVEQIEQNDYGLPVNQPLYLPDVTGLPRTPWSCVSQYPAANPSCPYCEGSNFAWEDGDGAIYSGSGRCKGCGAEISIRQIDESLP